MKKQSAFTLIELLIVVAIIAILAAIAVPNFLEAQTRAKTSRVKNDLRVLATVLESYAVDNNAYPPHLLYPGGTEVEVEYPDRYAYLTSPVAYMSGLGGCIDPFLRAPEVGTGGSGVYYSYTNIRSFRFRTPAHALNPVAGTHSWLARSRAPDSVNEGNSVRNAFLLDPQDPAGAPFTYDPTNGTVSRGDLSRTAKYAP
jgi:prepilin-type N-terminal cleavage/methylation domain-containing protein